MSIKVTDQTERCAQICAQLKAACAPQPQPETLPSKEELAKQKAYEAKLPSLARELVEMCRENLKQIPHTIFGTPDKVEVLRLTKNSHRYQLSDAKDAPWFSTHEL